MSSYLTKKTIFMSLPVYANEIDLLTQSHAIGFQLPVIVNTRNFPTYGTNLPSSITTIFMAHKEVLRKKMKSSIKCYILLTLFLNTIDILLKNTGTI